MTAPEGEQAEPTEEPPSHAAIPLPIYGIVAALFAAPAVQAWCLLQGQTLLNFGPSTSANLSYLLFAPISAVLLLRRHARARSSLYFFSTFEILRCLRSDHLALAAVVLVVLAYVQLPSVRAVYPMLDAQSILARIRGRF